MNKEKKKELIVGFLRWCPLTLDFDSLDAHPDILAAVESYIDDLASKKDQDMVRYIEDGYPTEKALEKIRSWEMAEGKIPQRSFHGLMDFVQEIWHWGERQYSQHRIFDSLDREAIEYKFSTGGWSGNEDIVGALQDNQIFWMLCWYSSRVGGHYVFRVRNEEIT